MTELKLKQINKPSKSDRNEDIAWFCNSLGLSSGRDTSFTSNRIITDILEKTSDDKRVYSEGIANDLDLTQGLVNHHLRNLIQSGLVVREKKQILIRGGSLKEAIVEMRRDAMRIFDDIERIAEEIDEEMGIENRQ